MQRRPVYPLLYKHRFFLTPLLDYVVGTQIVFKQLPFKDGLVSIHSLVSISLHSFLTLRALSSGDLSLSGTSARGSAVHLVPVRHISLSLISYQALFLTASYLGRQPTSQPLA